MFWRFWWACGPCGLLASLGRSWVLGVLLGRVLVLRKCIPNVSMQQVCLEAHHIAIGASLHALVDETSRSTTAGMGCTAKARQASPGRPQTVLRVMIQINQRLSRQQRASHWVLLRLLLQQQPQATASEPLGSAPLPPSATIHLLRLLLQLMFLNLAPPIQPATHRGLCCVHGCKALSKHCVSATDWVLCHVQTTSCSLDNLKRWNCQSRWLSSCCSVIAMNGRSQAIFIRTLRPWTRFFHRI